MGMIAKVISFFRATNSAGAKINEAKVNPGGGANITAEVFQPAGEDSFPLPSDYAILINFMRTGSFAVAGYVDPINAGTAQAGEKRVYSRDANGAIKAEFHLKNDGTILCTNTEGTIQIDPDGKMVLSNTGTGKIEIAASGIVTINNDVEIDTSGNIDMTGDITTTGNINCADLTATGTITGDTVLDGTIELGNHAHGGVTSGAGVTVGTF